MSNRIVDRRPVRGGRDFNCGLDKHVGAKLAEFSSHIAGLVLRTGNEDGATEEWTRREPIRNATRLCNLADDHNGGWAQTMLIDKRTEFAEGCEKSFLIGQRAAANNCGRRGCRFPVVDESAGPRMDRSYAHVEDQRPRESR